MIIYERNFRVFVKLENGEEKDFGWVFNEGYIKGDSEYFIATEETIKDKDNPLIYLKTVKWAIFSGKDGKRLTDFFDWISPLGLVRGNSEYFRAEKNKMEALFSLDGRKTKWFQKIRDRGALTGESKYYWGKENGKYALYSIETNEKLTDDFKSSVLAGALLGKSERYIVGSYGDEIFFIYDIKNKKVVSKEFDEHKLVEILKNGGDLEKALEELKL